MEDRTDLASEFVSTGFGHGLKEGIAQGRLEGIHSGFKDSFDSYYLLGAMLGNLYSYDLNDDSVTKCVNDILNLNKKNDEGNKEVLARISLAYKKISAKYRKKASVTMDF